ncbi:MAG: TatD family hydrolase [Phycisphaerae bacterium]|nr:TatD family hydrolase [Phycisphaerae bacterium]
MIDKTEISFCDSHLHLQDPVYPLENTAMIQRAIDVNIRLMVCNGTSPDDWPAIKNLADKYDFILPCFGVHPWFVQNLPDNWHDTLKKFLTDTPSAIGEIGLDRWKEPFREELRTEVFIRQLDLAIELSRPAIIHCLKAWDQLLAVLKHYSPFENGLLIHAFSGSTEMMHKLLDYNAYFSIAADALRPDRSQLHETLRKIPLDRILVETDSPDMLPLEKFRTHTPMKNKDGKKLNEPANLPAIVAGLAEILNINPETLTQTLWLNSTNFYSKITDKNE